GFDEAHALPLRQRRSLAGRPVDDDAVGAVLDEEQAELAVPVVVNGAVRVERGDGRGQDLPEHSGILRRLGHLPSPDGNTRPMQDAARRRAGLAGLTRACLAVLATGCGGSSRTHAAESHSSNARPTDPGCKKEGIRYTGKTASGVRVCFTLSNDGRTW